MQVLQEATLLMEFGKAQITVLRLVMGQLFNVKIRLQLVLKQLLKTQDLL